MALPTTIVSSVGHAGHHPPFKSSGGAFYVVVTNPLGSNIIDVFKATDPTDSWTVQDAADNPINVPIASGALAAVQDGDKIHIATIGGGANKKPSYHLFNMATDNWDVTEEEIEANFPQNPTNPWISIAVRSDGDVVVVYAGDTDQDMGGKKERVDVNIRTVTTWGGPVALDAAGDIHYGNPNCVLGTNDFVHCVFHKTSNTADPPTVWLDTHGRSLDPADDTLSTVVTSTESGNSLLSMQNLVTYDDAGTQRIAIQSGNSGSDLVAIQMSEDANDELQIDGGHIETLVPELHHEGKVSTLSVAELSGDLHLLYSGGGTAGVDEDLYYTKSTDDGVNWDTPTEEIDAITVNFISANIYVRGSDTVMAYVYDDGGVQKYNEKVLIAGADVLQAQVMM